MATIPFRRLSNGVLMRSLPAGYVAPETRKTLTPEEKTARAEARKAERLKEKRLTEIGTDYRDRYETDYPKRAKEDEIVNRLVKREIGSIENYDIIDRVRRTITENGIRRAALVVVVMYRLEGAAARDYGLPEGDSVEDIVSYTVYRDANNPAKLRITF